MLVSSVELTFTISSTILSPLTECMEQLSGCLDSLSEATANLGVTSFLAIYPIYTCTPQTIPVVSFVAFALHHFRPFYANMMIPTTESILAKRRGYGTIVSYNVPPYGKSLSLSLFVLYSSLSLLTHSPVSLYSLIHPILLLQPTNRTGGSLSGAAKLERNC
jgi:hypothetical protein